MNQPAIYRPEFLITGATGFLGGCLAADLLATPEWDQVVLLVRAEDSSHAYQRVVRSLARFTQDLALLERVRPEQVLCGDFTQPAAFIGDARLTSIKRVVHCAALTSFAANNRAFTTNVDGTLRFVHHLRQVATIERFLHVSTAMICGAQPARTVREDDYPRKGVEHFVSYTESKAEAERLLKLTLPGFPIVVVRPTIVVGHTRLGCKPSGSIYWTFRMANAFEMIPCVSESRMDVVPVDYASTALQRLLFLPKLKYTSYHISAGEDSCCSWAEIAQAFVATRVAAPVPALVTALGDTGEAKGDATSNFRTASTDEISARKPEFDNLFGPCNKKFMMKAWTLYSGFAGLDTVFDSSRLREEGVAPSPRFSDYLAVCESSSAGRSIAEQGSIDFA